MDDGKATANETNRPLTGWKAIAGYFSKDERTVRRWAAEKNMPVRRVTRDHDGSRGGSVFAYPADLDRWLARHAELELDDAAPPLNVAAVSENPASPPGSASGGADRKRRFGIAALALASTGSLALGAVFAGVALWRAGAIPPAAFTIVDEAASPGESLYLDGIYHLETRTADGIARAIGLFTQAIAADSNFAGAYVGLADAWNLISQYTPAAANEAYARAKAAATRAIALDPGSSAAHAALAFNAFYGDRDLNAAQSLFRRAIELDPANARVRHWYALVAMQDRQFDIALAEIALAQRLDPRAPSILANKGLILFHAGRTQEALDILRPLAETQPTLLSPHAYLATIYLAQGRETDFLREYRVAAELSGNAAGMTIAAVAEQGFGAGGREAMLAAMFAEQRRLHAADREPAFKLALTAAMLGDNAAALDFLASSLRRGEQDILGIRVEPALAGLREDARYATLVAQAGFSP